MAFPYETWEKKKATSLPGLTIVSMNYSSRKNHHVTVAEDEDSKKT